MANLNALIAQGYQFQPPVNPFVQYGQMQQLEQGQQTNELNRMKMQEFQRGMEETNALRRLDPESPTYLQDVTRISPEKGFAFAKSQQEAKTARTEGQTKEVKLLTDKLSLLPQAYQMADTPEAYLALHQSVHADPVLGPWLKSTGATPEKGLATLQNAVQTGKFDDLRLKSMQSVSQLLDSMKPLTVAASSSVYDPRQGTFKQAPAAPDKDKVTDLMANYKAAQTQGFTGSIFDYERKLNESRRTPAPLSAPVAVIGTDGRRMYVSREQAIRDQMTPADGAATLKPLTEGQTIKLRTDVGKDYQNASTALSQIDDLLKSATLVKTSPGLSSATGYTGKYLPSFSEGGAAQAETRLANLRGKVTALGKATASMGGAIGSIATQEWKVLADQVAVLDETKGTKPLLEQISLLEDQARRSAELIRDKYEKTRAEDFERFPQFRDLPAPKSSAPAAAMSNVVITPDGQSHSFPTPAAAAQFKKAAGIP